MGHIKRLPRSVYSSLQSGVYLFDLTRIVEELIFNGIDAGCTKVDVSIDLASCYVKVEDNGHGISRNDLLLLGERYATSKLCRLDDIDAGVKTLGFRGEALSSLSDISLLEIITKACGMPNGYRKVIKGGKCVYLEIDDHRQEVGTTAICHEIFHNQPVRRKYFLTRSKKVLDLIKKCVLHVALVQPQVAFKVFDINSGHELLSTCPSPSCLPLVATYFGLGVSSTLSKVDFFSKGGLKLVGYLSTPVPGFSTKAFQFFYINSRFVSKSQIHDLLNNLAADFPLSHRNRFICQNKAKETIAQTYSACVLNLCCPISGYILTYESSRAIVEFKDWASILSFTEAAVRHSWGQLPDHLSQEKCSAHKDNAHVRETNVKEGTGVVTTLRDISESPRLMAKRCKVFHHDKSQSYLSPFNDLVSVSILNPSCHEKVSVNLSEGQKAITGTIKYLRVGYSSEGMTSAGCNIAGENNQFQTQKVWGNDIIFSSKSAIASLPVESLKWTDESKNGPMSRLKWTKYSDGDSDLRDELRGSTSRHGRSNYGEINREFLLQSKQNKRLKRVIPETFTFPGDAPNKSESSLSLQEYEKQSADFMTDMEWPSSSKGSDFAYLGFTDGNVDFIGKEKLQGRNSSYLMSIDMTKDHQTAKQLSMFPDDLVDSCPFSERCSRRQSYRLDALPQHVGHMETLCEAVEAKHYLSSLSSGNAGLEAKSYQLQDEAGHRYFMGMSYNEMKHEIGRDKLAENSFDEDWLPNSSGAGANLENQNWSSFGPDVEIFRGSVLPSNRNASSKKPKFVKKTKNRILNYNGKVDNHIHYHIFEHVDRESSHYVRRSCSAPPHYRGKQKFSVLTSPPAAAAVPELNLTIVNDFPILSAHCERKGLGQKSDISELAEPVLLSTCHSHLRKCTKKPQYRSMTEHKLHFENGSSSEGNVPTKWRNGEPEPKWDPVNDVMVVENMGNASSDYLDGVLDISSGLLFLSGNYLVPESVSKEYLEGAKVLQQVDRKFIPITAGGILAVVDQHAADERIRLEELRQNVLSGEGKSVSYLEYGKELVLPEFGFQLLQNYTDQISHWGWICDIHTDSMSSFTRNLNLLHQQAVTVTLIAVPCILGINLSEKDLLEFLDQLADTDGSSLMPPAVVRILNYRACRGAIMFGDSLFPSECSLIVDALKRTSLCFQCAHGRPTTVPLVNLEALHEQLNRLNSSHSEAAESWHGLRHYAPSIERVKMRLAAARSHG